MLPVIERRCSMADETTKKPDEQLLEDILNELDMTLADESMQKKIKDIMQRGKARACAACGRAPCSWCATA